MCNISGIMFAVKNMSEAEIKGKRIIEIGSCYINGSVRPVVELFKPKEYIGIDIKEGLGVDIICKAEDILNKFGKESFDVVISTELLEHVMEWKKVISNFKNICKSDGVIYITTRSYGFGYHSYPHDFWRYEKRDMEDIFFDCNILKIKKDTESPGIFLKIKKPKDFKEKSLDHFKLYNILLNKRIEKFKETDFKKIKLRFVLKEKIKNLLITLRKFILKNFN
jgi:2-polyprenyl-3-methyl-5-hydroxy-6-metoxy-1,4-benzoquinol methylase